MRKKLVTAIAFIVVLVVGGLCGAFVQHLRGGYWHKVLKTESFPFQDGEITLSYTAESIISSAAPCLWPNSSMTHTGTDENAINDEMDTSNADASCPHRLQDAPR